MAAMRQFKTPPDELLGRAEEKLRQTKSPPTAPDVREQAPRIRIDFGEDDDSDQSTYQDEPRRTIINPDGWHVASGTLPRGRFRPPAR
jgi:hypothetical protein